MRPPKELRIKIDVWENPVVYTSTRDWSNLYGTMRSESEKKENHEKSHEKRVMRRKLLVIVIRDGLRESVSSPFFDPCRFPSSGNELLAGSQGGHAEHVIGDADPERISKRLERWKSRTSMKTSQRLNFCPARSGSESVYGPN